MSWRDELLPASFRGAEFFIEDGELEGGRRVVNHEFPLRDDAYVEDLGKKNRRYVITGYVLGPDYFADRDALVAALEQDDDSGSSNGSGDGTDSTGDGSSSGDGSDSGTLIHPYLGPLTVKVDTFKMRETRDDGGMPRFEMVFLDAGEEPSPVSGDDTQDGSDGAADDTGDGAENGFG